MLVGTEGVSDLGRQRKGVVSGGDARGMLGRSTNLGSLAKGEGKGREELSSTPYVLDAVCTL